MEALAAYTTLDFDQEHQDDNLKVRLQKQMKDDALHPISDVETVLATEFSTSTLEEIRQFLRLQASKWSQRVCQTSNRF
jgi:hypothetical protein